MPEKATRKKWIGAGAFVPTTRRLSVLREAAKECRGCDLFEKATQTVFGNGTTRANVMLIGETPGDHEDKEGRTFVGPAGRLLVEVLAELGVKRSDLYLTNAVKHFRFEPRGKRRIHSRPLASEVTACWDWLEAELRAVKPEVIVCLGAVALSSLMGSKPSVMRDRGKILESRWARAVIATYHPSAVLRAPDSHARSLMRGELKADLSKAIALGHGSSTRPAKPTVETSKRAR